MGTAFKAFNKSHIYAAVLACVSVTGSLQVNAADETGMQPGGQVVTGNADSRVPDKSDTAETAFKKLDRSGKGYVTLRQGHDADLGPEGGRLAAGKQTASHGDANDQSQHRGASGVRRTIEVTISASFANPTRTASLIGRTNYTTVSSPVPAAQSFHSSGSTRSAQPPKLLILCSEDQVSRAVARARPRFMSDSSACRRSATALPFGATGGGPASALSASATMSASWLFSRAAVSRSFLSASARADT